MNRFKLNKFNRLNKNVLLILFLVFSVLFILGCNITYNGTNLLVTPTSTMIATIPIKTIVVTPVIKDFECRVIAQTLNVRSCESKSCSSIGNYSVYNDILTVKKISLDNNWYYIKEFGGGWINSSYCIKKGN